jgi:hypothetical protein
MVEVSTSVSKDLRLTYRWLHELDAIVNRRVVRGGDHESDRVAAQGLRSQSSYKATSEDHRVEEFPVVVNLLFES